MEKKLNCWEFMKCGREPGGTKVKELGVCPAAIEGRVSGFNCGKNAGRCCWAVAGTFCEGDIKGTFASKLNTCLKCNFFKLVCKEEEGNLKTTKDVLEKLQKEEGKGIKKE